MGTSKAVVRRLFEPVDPAGLAAFRIAFGLLMVVLVIRYFAHGWIDAQFVEPSRFFPYPGLEWIRPWPSPWMHFHFAALGGLALFIAAGLCTRPAAFLFCAGFTYVHLIDKSNYLNHYYLISLLSALLAVVPSNACASLDARWGLARSGTVPAWTIGLLRFQVCAVYFFAGVAKLQPDWLLRAQPLKLWLSHTTDLPVIGALLGEPSTAYLFSWVGAAFDLLVPFLLLIGVTRRWAFAAAVAFHAVTAALFPIGLFPWIMIACALVFFPTDWPRRFLGPWSRPEETPAGGHPAVVALLGAYVLIQILVPLRSWLYPGDVLWREEGFRFSWRVMVAEKTARARFIVRDRTAGDEWEVHPREYLSPVQAHYLSGQPDMIRDFARMIRAEAERRGRQVEVRADVRATVNGRLSRPLVDPRTDLSRAEEIWRPAPWILPYAPSSGPQEIDRNLGLR